VFFDNVTLDRSTRPTGLRWCAATFLLAAFSFAPLVHGQNGVDFQTQILPILKNRCFECHNGGDVKGNLRLDSKAGIDERGFSGLPIVGLALDESELVLRITSDDDAYRMPKSASALPQNEIDLLTNWVSQGAPFSTAGRTAKSNSNRNIFDWLADAYLRGQELLLQKSNQYAGIVLVAFLLYLMVVVAAVVVRHQAAKRDVIDEIRFPWARLSPFFFTTTVFGIVAFITFQHGRVEEAQITIDQLQKEISSTANANNQDKSREPVAPKLMHPKRLGGIYYRGNDERSEQLFNGGFYRTAELTVQLVDQERNPIRYGDSVNKDMAILLQVKRAIGTEPAMFTPRSIGNTFVSASYRGTESADDRKILREIDKGNSWEVLFPIPNGNQSEADPIIDSSGTLYVYYGPLDNNRIHYSIHYDLRIDGAGNLTTDSEIWMGSTYNLNGRVVIPGDDEIALHHWFDFRPIPEIEDQTGATGQ
jgi:hypothetical protein